jgi:hypothetical protein
MSSHWNYRILAKRTPGEIQYGLYEVHYENDIPIACTENNIAPVTFSSDIEDPIESLIWKIDAMKLACSKKILDYDKFPQEYLPYYRKKKLLAIEELIK